MGYAVHLLTLYSDAYASNQFRALQQFFRWLAEEEQLPDPMTRLRAPKVGERLVPVFTSEELSALEKICQGRRPSPAGAPRRPCPSRLVFSPRPT